MGSSGAVGLADPEPGVAGHRQRQHTEHERQQRQEREVAAVGGDQPGLTAGQRPDLTPSAGLRRFAQPCRAGGRRWPSRRSGVARQKRPVHTVGVGADPGEDVGPVGAAHRRPDLRGRVGEGGLAARRQQQQLVAHAHVGQRMRDDDDHPAGVGEPAQHRHHLPVQRRVEPRGRFVEDQQRRAGQQLHGHRCAFALPAGQLVDASLLVRSQLQLVEHPLDHLPAIVGRGVGRQSQFGGVTERLLDGELAVHDVVLGHHPDPRAHRGVLGVHVVPVEGDHTGAARHRTANQLDQRGFSGAGRPDHRGQCPRFRGEGHILQQLAPVDGQRQPMGGEPAGARRRGLRHQGVAGREQVGIADGDDVAVAQHRPRDQGAVDESAVAAVVVADLQTGRAGYQHRVHAGGQRVVDDDGVGLGATDRHQTRRSSRPRRGRTRRLSLAGRADPVGSDGTAVPVGRTGGRVCARVGGGGVTGRNAVVFGLAPTGSSGMRSSVRGLRGPDDVADCGDPECQLWATWAAQRDAQAVADGHQGGARTGDVNAVLAFVDDDPLRAVEPQDRMHPRYQREVVRIDVVEADVAAAVATDDDVSVDRKRIHRRSEPNRQWRHADAARHGELCRVAAVRRRAAAICRCHPLLSIPRDPVRDAYEHIAAASNDRWPASSRVRAVIGSKLNLYLTSGLLGVDHKTVRRLLGSLCATVCTAFVTLAAAPTGGAVGAPWFAPSVGNATQVVSVVGVGGSNAKLDVYQLGAAGWQPVAAGIPAHVGSAGLAPQAKSGYPATPMGVYSLPFAFGTAPNPGGGLKYVQVGLQPLVERR